MLIKTSVRLHYLPTIMNAIKNSGNTSDAGDDAEGVDPSCTACQNVSGTAMLGHSLGVTM